MKNNEDKDGKVRSKLVNDVIYVKNDKVCESQLM